MLTVERVVRGLARLAPQVATPDDDLVRALAFLPTDLRPETVLAAGNGLAVLVLPVVFAVAAVTPGRLRAVLLVLGIGTAFGLSQAVHAGPKLLASARRSRAIGSAPTIVGLAALRMEITPSVERAATFAARSGDGPLAERLSEHVRRASAIPQSGFETFGEEWACWFPALERSLSLLAAAGTEPPEQREQTLERALETALDGTRDRLATFAADLKGPTTAVYAFGVMLPLALVAALPAARTAGLAPTLPILVTVYDVVLPAVLVGAAAWLLVRRPVAFPPARVPRSHPDLPDRAWPPLAAGVLVGVASGTACGAVVTPWTAPIAALGTGCGTALVVRYRPDERVRAEVEAVESGLTDALVHVGHCVESGVSAEAAIATAPEHVPTATGRVFDAAARRQRELGRGVESAFLGEYGALADVPSSRARSVARLLAVAADEGQPAGSAIRNVAAHLEELGNLESEVERDLAHVTRTLSNTATVFGPLVAGATVALAAGVAGDASTVTGQGPSTTGLGLAVGWYVLVLACVLTTLSTGLVRGIDRSAIGYRVGIALLSATATYVGAFLVAGALV